MMLNKNLKNILLVVFTTLILSACSTAKKSGNIDGDVYTGKETVKFLASGVPDLSLIHISEPTRRRGISYAVFCLKKKK